MKKSDKFDRMVWEREVHTGPGLAILPNDAALLLRQYHQEVVETVDSMRVSVSMCGTAEYAHGYNAAIRHIKAKLKEMAKMTPDGLMDERECLEYASTALLLAHKNKPCDYVVIQKQVLE